MKRSLENPDKKEPKKAKTLRIENVLFLPCDVCQILYMTIACAYLRMFTVVRNALKFWY